MKTLLIAPEVFRAEGGIARILRAYLHALASMPGQKATDNVGLIVMNDRTSDGDRMPKYLQRSRIKPMAMSNRSKAKFIFSCFRYGLSADLILCGHLHQSPVIRMLKRLRPRLKYHIIAHGIEVWRPYSGMEKQALLHADSILCVSDYTRKQILHHLPTLDPQRLVVIPNTLDPDFSLPDAPAPRELNQDLRILSVGRLTNVDIEKGFESMIRAMPLIRQRIPGATLRIAGGGNDLERLRALATEHGGPGVIELLGRIDDESLRNEYAQCDLFALPSRKEGFGLVYLEAMSFGKPCLAARARGAPEVVTDEVGALVEYDDQEGIAKACAKLSQALPTPEKVRAHLAQFSFSEFQHKLFSALNH